MCLYVNSEYKKWLGAPDASNVTGLGVKTLNAPAHLDKNLLPYGLTMLLILEMCEFLEKLLKDDIRIDDNHLK